MDILLAIAHAVGRAVGPTPGPGVCLAAGWIGAALGALPHELAHAAIARGRGATHVRVVVGLGPGLRVRLPWPPLHWLSVHLRLCPAAGHARAHGPGLDGDAEAQAAIALAGPVASVGCAAAFALAVAATPATGGAVASLVHWSVLDALVFSACGALQLVPGLGTDGSHALRALRTLRALRAPLHPAALR